MSGLAVFALLAVWVLAGLAACVWIIRPLKQRIADIEARANGCHIDDTELADWLAIGVADYQAETDHNPQAGLDRLRDEIQQQREEEQQ